MEKAVKAELAQLRHGRPRGGGSLAEGALVLAQALDQFSATAESAAHLSAIVKAHQELRATLGALRRSIEEGGASDDSIDDASELGSPVPAAVWDAPQP